MFSRWDEGRVYLQSVTRHPEEKSVRPSYMYMYKQLKAAQMKALLKEINLVTRTHTHTQTHKHRHTYNKGSMCRSSEEEFKYLQIEEVGRQVPHTVLSVLYSLRAILLIQGYIAGLRNNVGEEDRSGIRLYPGQGGHLSEKISIGPRQRRGGNESMIGDQKMKILLKDKPNFDFTASHQLLSKPPIPSGLGGGGGVEQTQMEKLRIINK